MFYIFVYHIIVSDRYVCNMFYFSLILGGI